MSTRTLRYYESCGLIAPARAENGCRIYAPSEVKRLAQILSMKRCGLPLATIKQLMSDGEGNIRDVLEDHLRTLQAQGASLEMAITRTKAAIAAIERIEEMDVKDAFEKMKEEGLKNFEDTYGKEARERYGDATIDASNERMMALTKDEWEAKELLEDAIKIQLRIALQTQDPQSEAAQELAREAGRDSLGQRLQRARIPRSCAGIPQRSALRFVLRFRRRRRRDRIPRAGDRIRP